MTSAYITVLLADDHAMFREALRFSLAEADDITVVGEAADGQEAVTLARELLPDVVIMDLDMPHLDGLAATSALTALAGGQKVLVLTMYEDDARVFASLKAGATGYVVKGVDPDGLIRAVRAVAAGHAVIGPLHAARMLTFLTAPPRSQADAFPQLTTREKEVLSYLADGLTNKEIAAELFVSPVTVRNHVSNILAKLQLTDRRQAMIRARQGDTG